MAKITEVRLSGKCSDSSYTDIIFEDGGSIENYGYVPYIKGIGGGDYIDLRIENETGRLIGWVPLKHKDLEF